MAPSTARGQVLTEMIWIILLITGFAVLVTRLYQASAQAHHKPRWEIQKEKQR